MFGSVFLTVFRYILNTYLSLKNIKLIFLNFLNDFDMFISKI